MTTEHPLQLTSLARWIRLQTLAALVGIFALLLPVYSQTAAQPNPGKITTKTTFTDPSSSTNSLPPIEIELARLDHHHQLLEASLGPLKTALSKLDELALFNARLRDYESAIAARLERERIATDLDRIAKEMLILETRQQVLKTSLLPDQIQLSLREARLDGVQFDENKKALTRWERPGAYAEWNLPGLPPGGYEVLLTYQCSPLEGGTVTINEKTFSLSGEMDTTLRGPEAKNLGTLKITEGSGSLRLSARTIVKDNLMDLLTVELIPANR